MILVGFHGTAKRPSRGSEPFVDLRPITGVDVKADLARRREDKEGGGVADAGDDEDDGGRGGGEREDWRLSERSGFSSRRRKVSQNRVKSRANPTKNGVTGV